MENAGTISVFNHCTLEDLQGVAKELIRLGGNRRVFAFFGEMGAGKTTLIREICKVVGVADSVSSPTFTLVNEYLSNTGEPVYHFDMYRIKSETEALDFGIENYLYSGYYCFIEWPQLIPGLIPDDALKINIVETNGQRTITLSE